MQALLPGLFISLGSMGAGSVTWIFAAKATRNMGPLKSMFLFQLMGVPLFMFLFPIAPHNVHINYLTISLIGFFETFMLLLLFYALQVGEATVVLPITDFYVFISAILGVVFLHESLYFFKVLGMIAIFIGIILVGIKLSSLHKKSVKLYKGVVPAALMAVGTGFYFYFVTISTRESGWLATAMGIRIGISVTAFILLLLRGERIDTIFKGATWKYLLPAVVSDVISFSLYNIAVSFAELSYVTIIYSTQTVLSVVFAYFFLKESLNKYQITGLIAVVAGLIFLQLR